MYLVNSHPNIVRDYNKAQGSTHVTDLSFQILRDYHLRNVSIQNSSYDCVVVGITNYHHGPPPAIKFLLEPGEIREVGINSQGGPLQFIWLLNPKTLALLGPPHPLQRNSNSFVIRAGLNKWFVQNFSHPSYYAAK